MNRKEYDYINPNHYKDTGTDKETFEIMIDIFGKEAFINFCRLNAFKYRMRIGKKPGENTEREINKILWYERKIEDLSEDRRK